jgi:hypothetical protein
MPLDITPTHTSSREGELLLDYYVHQHATLTVPSLPLITSHHLPVHVPSVFILSMVPLRPPVPSNCAAFDHLLG